MQTMEVRLNLCLGQFLPSVRLEMTDQNNETKVAITVATGDISVSSDGLSAHLKHETVGRLSREKL